MVVKVRSAMVTGLVSIDQEYDAASENPQSGTAVAQAVEGGVQEANEYTDGAMENAKEEIAANAELAATAAESAAAEQQAASQAAAAAAENAGTAESMALSASYNAEQAKYFSEDASAAKEEVSGMVASVQAAAESASQAAGTALDGANDAANAAAAAAASAEEAAQTLENAVTKTELDATLNAKTPLKEWQLLNNITLTEAVNFIDDGYYDTPPSELWFEGVIKFETDYTSAKTCYFYMDLNSNGTTYCSYWSVNNGSTHYLRAHAYKSPSNAIIYDVVHGNYYLGSTPKHTPGVKTNYSAGLDRCGISINPESGTSGTVRFAAGTTLKVWGR